ncbi:hypothetical protein FRC11_012293 [Ceratobasidium sp. 423]|nr:hypothetical protein FRC11_012293 [Ceratobasidium sp. 423]
MSSFLRIAGATALFVSLGLFARAAPLGLFVPAEINALVSTDAISCALNKLIVDAQIVAKIQACLNVESLVDLKVAVGVCVDLIKACADELLKIGAGVNVDVAAKADIVACVAAIITLLVRVCLQLTLKFGVAAVATIFADIDVCLKLLLVNLNICIDGVITLIVNAIVSVTVGLLGQVSLPLCASLLASVGVGAGVAVSL